MEVLSALMACVVSIVLLAMLCGAISDLLN